MLKVKLVFLVSTLLVLSNQISAQIKGNKNLATITQSMKGLKSIDIQFGAKIVIDYELAEEITLTADENLLEYIGISFEAGQLTLDQIKWIRPSVLPVITIGSPALISVYQGTHQTTTIKNVTGSMLNLAGNVGKIIVEGQIDQLTINTTGTDIDLSELTIDKAQITIDDDSKDILDKVNELETELSKSARLKFLSEIESIPASKKKQEAKPNNLKWIDFKIKNNSWKRNHFVVIGPKKDGTQFSYGFAMLPNQKRKERWSTGTQVFRESRSGSRELLVTITAEDEAQVVNLY